MKFVEKIQDIVTPHYLIIGHYSGRVIGCCCGKSGKQEVLAGDPLSTFKRISRQKCPVCKEFGLIR